ncbi:MAG TPA: T9SS type A sorting domain-containing protein [Chitinophagales bacterium]|nr:T9SS type A sorting domain-containing protein [Chitinophagales bacterium]
MKKIFYLSIFLFLFSKVAFTQSYREMRNEPDKYTFKQIQAAFYSEWEKKSVEERKEAVAEENGEGEYYQFKRWEQFMRDHLDEHGRIFNYSAQNFEEIQKAQSEQNSGLRDLPLLAPDWQSIGPSNYSFANAHSGGVGRVNCIAFHPNDSTTFWVGTPSGGLWKTINSGITWVPLTDGYSPCLGVSGIAVNPNNPDIIYILTGDGDGGDKPSIGVLKTTNGGITWNTTALSWNAKKLVHGYKLLMHPTNADVMFVATSKGVYLTTDGFSSIASHKISNEIVWDIEFHPTDPNYVYLATHLNFYRSKNGGVAWKNITALTTDSLPAPHDNTRLAIAVSLAQPNRVYVSYARNDSGYAGLYMSENKGLSFTQKTQNMDVNVMGFEKNGYGNDNQFYYDFTLASPPYNADIILIGGINLWKSTDKGKVWANLTHWLNIDLGAIDYLHADQHALEINPLDNRIYSGNDGGIYFSADTGKTWTDISAGLVISQIYRITNLDPANNNIYLGAQDNGVNALDVGYPSMSQVLSGDGSAVAFKNGNVFGANNFGTLARNTSATVTTPGSWIEITPPSTSVTKQVSGDLIYYPFAVDPVTPGTIWAGYDTLYKSTDNGDTWIPFPGSQDPYGKIARLAVSNNTHQNVFTVDSNGFINRLDGGGESYDATPAISLPEPPITDICLSTDSSKSNNYVWVCYGGYFSGKKVYRSIDGGEDYQNYSTGLPNVPVHCLAYMPGDTNHLVFAGTDIGIYYRDTTMSSWLPYNSGMPYVIVQDIKIDTAAHIILAATYGRGIWKTPLNCFSNLTAAVISGEYLMCAGESIPLTADGPCGYDSYLWSTGETTKSISVTANGVYTVTISDGTNSLTATHHLTAAGAGIVWEKTLGTTFSVGYSIEQTTDNGYIVASAVEQADGCYDNSDLKITKLDMEHNVTWQKCLGGSGNDTQGQPDVHQTADGGFIICSMTTSPNDGDVSGIHPYDDGTPASPDYWIVKLNAAGGLAWQKCLGGPGYDQPYSIQQTEDGGYIVAGITNENGGDVSGYLGGSSNCWIVKLAADGNNIEWQKCYYAAAAYSIRLTSDGGFIVAGIGGNNAIDYWILKLDSVGNIDWQKNYGGPGYDSPTSIQQTEDGGYIVAGQSNANGGYVSGNHGYNKNDYWIVKLDSVGNLAWQKSFGGTGDDVAYSIQQTEEGGFIVAGYTTSYDGDVSGNHPGSDANPIMADFWIVKLDSGGNLLWQKCLGGSSYDIAYSIQQTTDGTFIIAGYTGSHDGDVTGFNGYTDTWVVNLAAGCPAPFRDFAVTNLTSTSATLNWGTRDCVDGYVVRSSEEGSIDLLGTDVGNSGLLNLGGLTPSTNYEWSVASHCVDGGIDQYSEPSPTQKFTTPPVKLQQEKLLVFDCALYPNPTVGNFTLDITSSASGIAKIEITTLLGNLIYKDNLMVNEQNNTYEFNSVLQSQGLYIVTITLNNEKVVRKILRSN